MIRIQTKISRKLESILHELDDVVSHVRSAAKRRAG